MKRFFIKTLSIFLVGSAFISTSLGNCAKSVTIENVKAETLECIDNSFDNEIANDILDFEESEHLAQERIYDFLVSDCLLSKLEKNSLKIAMNSDFDFSDNFQEIEPIREKNILKSYQQSSSNNNLPVLSYNPSAPSTTLTGQVDGCSFIGLICNKEACISIYNVFAGFFNKQIMYKVSNSGSPLNLISEAFNTLKSIAVPSALVVGTIIAELTGFLSSLWAQFIALFTAGGLPGIILGSVIGLIGLACIATITAMIVFGYLGKGFAIGWKVHNIFWWESFHGYI